MLTVWHALLGFQQLWSALVRGQCSDHIFYQFRCRTVHSLDHFLTKTHQRLSADNNDLLYLQVLRCQVVDNTARIPLALELPLSNSAGLSKGRYYLSVFYLRG